MTDSTTDPAPMVIVGGTWVHIPPTPEEVDAEAILATLGGLLRWNGRLGPTCTVAAHTWALLRWAELARATEQSAWGCGLIALSNDNYTDLRRALLVHDWHEAWIGDVTGPVKRALREHAGSAALDGLQERIDSAIRTRLGWGGPSNPDVDRLVHEMDRAICSAEAVAWEMHPRLLPRVFAKHGDPDPWAIVASLEAKRIATRRALDGEATSQPASELAGMFFDLFPNWREEE